MRQNIQNEKYFFNYFDTYQKQIKRRKEILDSGQVSSDRVIWFKKHNLDIELNYIIASYTAEKSITAIKDHFLRLVEYIKDTWNSLIVLPDYNKEGYNQFTGEAYDQMIWMLSLGYLLNIEEKYFIKLVEVIDRDRVKDYLLEFIIRAKLGDRKSITEESYEKFFGVPQTFNKLRQAILQEEKSIAEKLIKDFLTEDWYKGHKNEGWYDSHKNEHNTYRGYWCFEAAAITKIMGLDDSSYRDWQYYPKDLVDYYDDNHAT